MNNYTNTQNIYPLKRRKACGSWNKKAPLHAVGPKKGKEWKLSEALFYQNS